MLSLLPANERAAHAAALEKGMKFLVDSQGADQALGTKGEWLEFPTYSNALAVIAFSRLQPAQWRTTVAPWVAYLKRTQHSDENGCAPEDGAYGGWGPQGLPPMGRRRQSDLASTRYALEALNAAGVPSDDKAWQRARVFLGRVQNLSAGENDGGFFFSTTHPELNKAGGAGETSGTPTRDTKQFRSYGTCTADGVICLSLFAANDVKTPLESASKWFVKFANARVCAGFDGTTMEAQGWKDGLNFYYRAALAEAATHVDFSNRAALDANWWRDLARVTMSAQGADGTWVSATSAMKENDPLTTTPLALETLLICREQLGKR